MIIKPGFVPALGTPLDENGYLLKESFQKQIERQIAAGCTGVLCMGSMGIQAYIRQAETVKVAEAAYEVTKGRVPLFVGTMDCSIHRAEERLKAMDHIPVDAFVFTAPYYASIKRADTMRYFKAISKMTKHNFMLYDLPSVTQSKITYDMVVELKNECANFVGIKTADTQMLRKLILLGDVPADFVKCYSGLDTFDVGVKWGIPNYLDGMIDCTPTNFEKMDKAMKAGDWETAGTCLTNVVRLRDFFLANDLWPCFNAAMHLLGFEGNFAPDFSAETTAEQVEKTRAEMIAIGEL